MKEIINHYGVEHQRKKLVEEMMELQEALIEYRNIIGTLEGAPKEYVEETMKQYRQHIIEEISDNFVLLGQFLKFFDIKNSELQGYMAYKIARTKEEMKND